MQQKLERYIQLCGNMLLPCFLFVVGLFTYLWSSNLDYDDGIIFHRIFFLANIILLLIYVNFNQGKTAFSALTIFGVYVIINHLKRQYGALMTETIYYQNMLLSVPLNLLLFYLNPPRRFVEKKSVFYLLFIALEITIIELLSRCNIVLSWHFGGINITMTVAFSILLITVFVQAVRFGKLYDYSLFFSFCALGFGLYFSNNPVGLSLFFAVSLLIMLFMIVYDIFYKYYYDEITGLHNRVSYLKDSRNLPPKYSLGVIKIDGFDGLRKGLNIRQRNELVVLISDIIQEHISENATLYCYDEDQFLEVCEKLNFKEIHDEFEAVRRHIAATEFLLNNHPVPIKVTISGGVAEKKRTDLNAEAVLARAFKSMHETLKFSGNVISPVLRKERR